MLGHLGLLNSVQFLPPNLLEKFLLVQGNKDFGLFHLAFLTSFERRGKRENRYILSQFLWVSLGIYLKTAENNFMRLFC